MGSNILNIGKSALNAAQIGISTTGHNIANASTPGYTRQVIVQASANAQNFGYGFLGQGAEVTSINRVYNELLARQMVSSQSTSASVDAYSAEMSNIDNLLSNPTAGLSPALQDFFSSMQSLASNPSDNASRQSLLSTAQSLATRFKSLSGSLNEMQQGVNAQITTNVAEVNTYATQIARLNEVIEKALSTNSGPPNDLMDQRDQLVNELSSKIKTTIVQQGAGTYNVFIGNGLPLVVGKDTFTLSAAQSLATRFQSLSGSLNEMQQGVNAQITTNVAEVNTYATQIARLNDVIEKALSTNSGPPNDLMDQRDQLVNELSSKIKTTVVQQGAGTYNIFIGNGLPLVVGKDTFTLSASQSLTDPGRLEVAYESKTSSTILGTESLPGGSLGGLLEFRKNSLDGIQNQLGQIAVVLAGTFNSQLAQGLDSSGNPGSALFSVPEPEVTSSSLNTGSAIITSQILDPKAVTSSDYRLQYDGTNYKITRLNDNQVQTFTSLPQTLDGISFNTASGTIAAGDNFLIQPTKNAASAIGITINDVTKLAVGGPALTASATTTNTGSGAITAPVASSAYAGSPLASAFSLTYNSGANTLSGFPATQTVTVTSGSTVTTFPAGTPITYTPGATIKVGNLSFVVNGTPANGDQFTITPHSDVTPGDNRNGLLLAGLQTAKTVNNGKISYADAFGQLVSAVGNKTRELQISAKAETALLERTTAAVQSQSGVNLDEEAANLLRYQQAYQAAGKMMQIAGQLFDVLLQLGT